MSPWEVSLKASDMELITSGTLTILEEENNIKDILCQAMIEMIKREWHQNWLTC